MEQVNFHFGFFFVLGILLVQYVAVRYLHLEVTFLDHFLQHKLVDHYVVLCVLCLRIIFLAYDLVDHFFYSMPLCPCVLYFFY